MSYEQTKTHKRSKTKIKIIDNSVHVRMSIVCNTFIVFFEYETIYLSVQRTSDMNMIIRTGNRQSVQQKKNTKQIKSYSFAQTDNQTFKSIVLLWLLLLSVCCLLFGKVDDDFVWLRFKFIFLFVQTTLMGQLPHKQTFIRVEILLSLFR